MVTEPPGNENRDWMRWDQYPPPYKRNQTIELWRESWGDETSFVLLGNVQCAFRPEGLWWRRA